MEKEKQKMEKENQKMDEYIYIRTQKYYEDDKIIKLGETNDLYGRHMTYKTGEYYPGHFIFICKVENSKMVEKKLKRHLKSIGYHCFEDG